MSTAPDVSAHLILDACCIINFAASGRLETILRGLPYAVEVAALVQEKEALWVFDGPDGHEMDSKHLIELRPAIEQGLVHVARFQSEAEQETFIEFTMELGDDGEAMTGALAAHRTWSLATDDRKAIALFKARCPHVPIVSTLAMIKYWAEREQASDAEVRSVLRNIQLRGKYVPRPAHPLRGWWQTFFASNDS